MNESLIGRSIMACFGALFLVFGLVLIRNSLILRRKGVRADAVLVGYISDGDEQQQLVEFQDRSGVTHRKELPYGKPQRVGETVEIIYDPKNPSEIIGISFMQAWGGGLICIGVGTPAVVQLGITLDIPLALLVTLGGLLPGFVFLMAWLSSWVNH